MQTKLENVNPLSLPGRNEVLANLGGLIEGRFSREEVSNWASQFLNSIYSECDVVDEAAWKNLGNLMAADFLSSPTKYFFSQENFEDWREDLLNSP